MAQTTGARAALIGAGMVARTHVAAIADTDAVQLATICARRPERAAALAAEAAERMGHPVAATTDLASVAADPAIAFAIVLTPPDARADVIRPLAQAGKHILLEKPMGRTAEEAREVVAICRDAGVTLGVVFQHRVRAASRAAAARIATGDLGALGLVEISVPWWRPQSYYDEPGRGTYARDGGGVLISQAIHTMDLALSLAGPVTAVRAMAATTRFHAMEAEDFVTAGLTFANGAVGSMVASTASFPGGAESITLHFERASLHLASGQLVTQWRDGRVEKEGATGGTGGGADPMAFTSDWHRDVIADFAQAIATGRDPLVTGEAALAAHDLIDATIRSARSGRPEEIPQ
ncbi:Predicted dehydrogenase [Loktanella atrilutea]|uniref:Predicted dehydrogenase n=1 Tax=Loktanella atrilutea TaxID=366533 RepID=A0A1M5D9P3_LOKAT|nr:Gfo/Idh/MocA family oxidoreductase [Loktanella atrilutea]SHF63674.1 Predicted dehydrogenase [Loktanella atrilutea]